MPRRRNRDNDAFSVSLLDLLSCGMGAVIILLIIFLARMEVDDANATGFVVVTIEVANWSADDGYEEELTINGQRVIWSEPAIAGKRQKPDTRHLGTFVQASSAPTRRNYLDSRPISLDHLKIGDADLVRVDAQFGRPSLGNGRLATFSVTLVAPQSEYVVGYTVKQTWLPPNTKWICDYEERTYKPPADEKDWYWYQYPKGRNSHAVVSGLAYPWRVNVKLIDTVHAQQYPPQEFRLNRNPAIVDQDSFSVEIHVDLRQRLDNPVRHNLDASTQEHAASLAGVFVSSRAGG